MFKVPNKNNCWYLIIIIIIPLTLMLIFFGKYRHQINNYIAQNNLYLHNFKNGKDIEI